MTPEDEKAMALKMLALASRADSVNSKQRWIDKATELLKSPPAPVAGDLGEALEWLKTALKQIEKGVTWNHDKEQRMVNLIIQAATSQKAEINELKEVNADVMRLNGEMTDKLRAMVKDDSQQGREWTHEEILKILVAESAYFRFENGDLGSRAIKALAAHKVIKLKGE